MKEIWDQWNDEIKQLFYYNYDDLSYLFDIKVDKKVDLVPTWKSTRPCSVARRFKLIRLTPELPMSQRS
ncbi:hypothetical protein Goarm_022273 [Gossypium armourianum]|uniref:Uncharacterized protein n=1 Tax=Gossypium armourianum TaxID=34283 RepID=A0A7J9KI13_9ROSI|nr:hypothetical protein [Gossypium armourianum]